MSNPETDLRALWTEQGVPQERQDELIAEIKAKGRPGAKVGPFHIKADFTDHKHPVMAVGCPDCLAKVGKYCIRPSGHRAGDFHAARKALADDVFIVQHGEAAWIERLPPGDRWKVHATGFRSELTEAGEQTVIPGCEKDDERTGAVQMSLF